MSLNDSLDSKLDNLNLSDKHKVNIIPKPSLLSTSLANQKHQATYESTQPESNQNDMYYAQEHPEPELLATSVGKDSNGRLIPSSSNISLFSLSQSQQYQSPQPQSMHLPTIISNVPSSINSIPQPINSNVSGINSIPQPISPHIPQHDDKYKIRSRNSYSSLNQKRFESYRLTSPPIQDSKSPSPIIQQEQFSGVQSIPIVNRNISSIPDSPSLDPTSLTNSPSRFWLSSQTPPKSMNNSYKRLPILNENPAYTQDQRSFEQRTYEQRAYEQRAYDPRAYERTFDKYDPRVMPMNIKKGDDSPTLNPVQTPNGEQMTPLHLTELNSYFSMKLDNDITEEDEKDMDDMNVE